MDDRRVALQPFSPQSVTLRRRWVSYLRTAGALSAVVGAFAMVANAGLWPLALGGCVVLLAAGFVRSIVTWERPSLEVSADGIWLAHVQSREVWSRARLRQGLVLPGGRVRFDMSDTSVLDVALGDDSGGRLLDAVGFGPAQRLWRTRMRSLALFGTLGVFVMLALVAVAGAWGALIGLLFGSETAAVALAAVAGVLAALLWVANMWPETLVLGADGVLVGAPWRLRLIPYDSLESATLVDGVWRFSLRDGKELRFATDWDADEQASLSRWLETALSVQRGAYEQAKVEVWVDRGGRTTESWLAGLRRLLEATSDYRSVAPDRDAIRALLTSGGALAHQRVAAAIALCSGGGDEERDRVRIAADATVQPALRDALERIVAGEEDEVVAERLEALERHASDG